MTGHRHLLEYVVIVTVFLQDVSRFHNHDDLWLRLHMAVALEELYARIDELLELKLIEWHVETIESKRDGRYTRVALCITQAGIAWGQREITRLDAASRNFRAVITSMGLSVDAALRGRRRITEGESKDDVQ